MKQTIKTSMVYQNTVGWVFHWKQLHKICIIYFLATKSFVDKMYYCKYFFKTANMRNLFNIYTKERKK